MCQVVHIKGITINVSYDFDEFSPEHIYYTLDGSKPNTSSPELTVGDNYIDLSSTGNKTYIFTALVIDEAGWQTEDIDIVRETFRIDDNRYKINVNALHGSYEIIGAETLEGESEPHAWYGDIIGIKYLPDDGYELYKLYRNGREESSNDSYYVYECQGDTTLDIKFRYRVNVESYIDSYQFQEGIIIQPEYTLNTQDNVELAISTTKDGELSSLYNSGEYEVHWSIDNEYYIGGGIMNIVITPVQVTITYGDNSNFIYTGEIQNINYEITEDFDYCIKYYLNGNESELLNAGDYTVVFTSDNDNYVIINGESAISISKREINVSVGVTEYVYTSKKISFDYQIDEDIESQVVFTLDGEICEFINSGEYIYEIIPVDTTNYIFINNTGNCSISKVDVYFTVEKTNYHYTSNIQSLQFSMVDENGDVVDFVNGLNIIYTRNDNIVDFKEPGEYTYTFITEDNNYNLYNVAGDCSIEIVVVNIVVDKTIYEYTGSEIDLEFKFTDESGEEVDFDGITYNIYHLGESATLLSVGVYEYEFSTDDVYYSLKGCTGEVEIVVASVEIVVESTTFKYAEEGITFKYTATSNMGNDYYNENSLISAMITQNDLETNLLNVGQYQYQIISLDENIVLFGDVSGDITIECKEIIVNVTSNYVYSGNAISFEYSLSQEIPVNVSIPDNIIDVNEYEYSIVSNDSNYVVVNGNGKINVLPKPVNVTILNYDFTYNGCIQTIPYDLTIDIENSFKTYINGVEKEFKDAGVYNLLFTSLNKNYAIESTNIELCIKQKEVEIHVSNLTQTYGKDEKTIDVNIEENVSYEVKFEQKPIDVNNYPFKVVLTDPNYIGLYEGTLVINKKTIDISPISNQYKIYGDEDGTIVGSVKGLCDGDNVEYSLIRENGENVGVYEIKLNTFISDNYIANYISDFYSINRRQLIVKVDNKTKIYGEIDGEFTYQILSGNVLPEDNLSASFYRESGENVGSYKIYLAKEYNNNYNILFSSTSTLTIKPKDLKVTINNIETIYSQEKPLTYVIDDEYDASQITGEITREEGKNVGSYVVSKGTLSSINYNLIVTNGVYTINPRDAYVTANLASKFYGEMDNLTYSVSNLCDGDELDGELSRELGEDVGVYDINIGTLNNDNYNINFTSSTLTIMKAEINIVIDDKTQVYGEEGVPLTYSVSGLKFDDQLELELFRNGGENAGRYYISCHMTPLDNYYIGSIITGIYEIEKANIVPTIDSQSFTYSGEEYTIDCEFPYELRYEYSLNGKILESMIDVGTYSVVAIFDGNDNYNPSQSQPVRVTIKKCPVNFILAENKFISDGNAKSPEFYFDERCGLSVDNVIYTFEDGKQPVNAGQYAFNLSIIDPNYEGSATGILIIKDSLVINCGGNTIIECADATFDDSAMDIKMVSTSNIIKIEDKNVVSSFTFENYDEEKDYIYTIRIKATKLKNASLYQVVDGDIIEIAVSQDGDSIVFSSNNLKGEFFIAKDKLDSSIVTTIALVTGVVTLGGLFIALKVIKTRKLRKSKVSNVEVDNYNIG